MKKLFLVFSMVALAIGIVGCVAEETTTEAPTTTEEVTTAEETTTEELVSQGVSDDTILVGNTAATSGVFSAVGVPFNDAIKAVFEDVNESGGIDGRSIELVTYDDEFNASLGVTFTETLVEQDEVFALVGHFGTPTVGSTLDYIQNQGVPMVYAATGINALYSEDTVGNPVLPVQPIYRIEGRMMLARALTVELYGETNDAAFPTDGKIVVIYTNDDAGTSIKLGIEDEMTVLGLDSTDVEFISTTTDTMSSAITDLSFADADAVLLAMNQAPFATAVSEMATQLVELPVFTSYVNASPAYLIPAQYSADRPILANAWVDVFSEEQASAIDDFVEVINGASFLTPEVKEGYLTNSFAIAGYIAAKVFVEGLLRVEANGDVLNWDNYISAMEESPINIPMGGIVDYTNGNRFGVTDLALLQYFVGDNPLTTEVETEYATFVPFEPIESVEEVEAKIE